jgi:hypothetical protein
MGFDEGLLESVLTLVAVAEHVPAVGQQWRVVTLEDRWESPSITCLQAPHECRVVVPEASSQALRAHGS